MIELYLWPLVRLILSVVLRIAILQQLLDEMLVILYWQNLDDKDTDSVVRVITREIIKLPLDMSSRYRNGYAYDVYYFD